MNSLNYEMLDTCDFDIRAIELFRRYLRKRLTYSCVHQKAFTYMHVDANLQA